MDKVTNKNQEEKKIQEEKPEKNEPIKEWIKKQSLITTADIKVPELLLDQVIGQDKAVDIVRKAAEQKRHVMLIGDPGTGKSMVARAMTSFLPKEELEDIIVYPNNDDSNTPHIRVVPGGKANEIVKAQREEAKKKKLIRYFGFTTHKNMAKCLAAGAKLDWIDVIMTAYNFRLMQDPELQDAIDACHEANIGLVAMKTTGKTTIER